MSSNPKKKPHATKSWEEMMSNAQLNALKPYIDAQVQMGVHVQFQKTLKLILENISQVQVRVWALERVLEQGLPVNKENLKEQTANIEDESQGMTQAEDGAQENDTLRIEFSTKAADKEYTEPQATIIHKLMNKLDNLVQTYEELEQGLIGIKKGEEREVVLVGKGPGEKDMTVKVKATRVSRRKPSPVKAAPAPKPEEAEKAPEAQG